ncbi:MAG: hypothetical protein A3G75_12010 [Verrucomicrobia bacterium RIFCSPLOWO2_12_FULL_64_8]|nr:MAG: hypothetical protein A3G75_12010 [Verrucomicrobia bacterium RIFCSPLOWO2_12_FULL_64_8]
MDTRTAALTDIGRIREENEDRFLCDDTLRLYAVADGIGGLAGGAQAAQTAVDELAALAKAQPDGAGWDFAAMVARINEHVSSLGRKIDADFGIGTTLTATRLLPNSMVLAHVGDSSCFLLHNSRIEKLTHDHTLENEVKARRARGEFIFLSPRSRQALTRCIGQPVAPEVDVHERALGIGDRILLVSDGITRFVPEHEMERMLIDARDPAICLKDMVDLANSRGGYDNSTGVLIFIDSV